MQQPSISEVIDALGILLLVHAGIIAFAAAAVGLYIASALNIIARILDSKH